MAPITRLKNFMAEKKIFESELRKNNSDVEILQEIFESELCKNNSDVEILHA
ncbi:26053_t:CDS:1, partial [Dentiscutata erythropus]